MAAKETLTIEVLTQQAQRNVDALNKSLGGLKTALGALAIGALLRNVVAFADAIQDTADVTKIANNVLIGFANTVAANGGTFDDALAAARKFNLTLGELMNGSKAANDAFRQLGFTTEEILSPDIDAKFEKTIKRLAELEKQNASLAQSVTRDIFGKTLDTTNIQAAAAGYSDATREALQYVSAQKAVADLQDKLDRSFIKLQLSILKALEPLAEKIAALPQEKIDQMIDSFIELSKALVSIGAAVKTLSVFGTIIGGIATYIALAKSGMKEWAKTISAGATRVEGFKNAWKGATSVLGKVWELIRHIGFQMKTWAYGLAALVRFIPILAAVATALYAINEAVKFAFDIDIIGTFIDYVKKAALAVGEFLGLYDRAADEAKKKQEELNKKLKEEEEQRKKKILDQIENNRLLSEYRQDLAATVADVRKQNIEFVNQTNFLKEISGLSEDQKEIEIAKRDAIQRNMDAIAALRKEQEALKDETGKFKDLTLGAEKYAEIEKAINRILAGNAALKKSAEERVLIDIKARQELDKQAHAAEMLAQKLQFDEAGLQLTENLSLIGLIGDKLTDQTKLIEHQRDLRKIMNDFEVEYLKLKQREQELGEENFKRELQQLEELTRARIQAAQAQYQTDQQTTEAGRQAANDWGTAWDQAYEQFLEDIPTKGEQATQAFKTLTDGMTDAFVKFAQTGKLSFKDLINNLIATIIQSKIQEMIAAIFNPAGALGGGIKGIFGKIFGIPGFANGGSPPVGKPSIVGEKGPELFIPKTAGTVVPNGQFGGGSVTNNYITNNISAIDSKSVAQLFAENRKTLLGTVQMAQKEMPR